MHMLLKIIRDLDGEGLFLSDTPLARPIKVSAARQRGMILRLAHVPKATSLIGWQKKKCIH